MKTRLSLSQKEVVHYVRTVFAPTPNEKMAFLIDLPTDKIPGDPIWTWRIVAFAEWCRKVEMNLQILGLQNATVFFYQATGADGAQLPDQVWKYTGGSMPLHWNDIEGSPTVSLQDMLNEHQIVLMPTQFSATQYLSDLVATLRLPVRIATLPGVTPEMLIPALFKIDYDETTRRVMTIKRLLDSAVAADVKFLVNGEEEYCLHIDLSHSGSHPYRRRASTGQLRQQGLVANGFPAEVFTAPYDSADSETSGWLPIQHDPQDEPILYRFKHNRVVEVQGKSRRVPSERRLLSQKLSGNLGEVGFGVLHDLGVEFLDDVTDPDAVMLLLEKLGLHFAFGRGGKIKARIHRDHIMLQKYMPRILVAVFALTMRDGSRQQIIVNGKYVPELFSSSSPVAKQAAA